jgi:hypothetical protein
MGHPAQRKAREIAALRACWGSASIATHACRSPFRSPDICTKSSQGISSRTLRRKTSHAGWCATHSVAAWPFSAMDRHGCGRWRTTAEPLTCPGACSPTVLPSRRRHCSCRHSITQTQQALQCNIRQGKARKQPARHHQPRAVSWIPGRRRTSRILVWLLLHLLDFVRLPPPGSQR